MQFGVVIGSALIALALTVISWRPIPTAKADSPSAASPSSLHPSGDEPAKVAYKLACKLFSQGKYADAEKLALANAESAQDLQLLSISARSWTLAGSCSLVRLHAKQALERYRKAISVGERCGDEEVMLTSYGNMAGVYLQLGDLESAAYYSELGLRRPTQPALQIYRAQLRLQLAQALSRQGRFDDARPLYRETLENLESRDDFAGAFLGWYHLGSDASNAGRLEVAESALTRALYLARMHKLGDTGSVLRKLGRLKAQQGDTRSAANLYNAAVAALPGNAPVWLAYADRGEFLLAQHDYAGAFRDFTLARELARVFRANVVPNEQGRVSQENGLARIADGFIEAGNHIARNTASLAATFDAAEEDRSTSLSALTPVSDDWRTRLPTHYWGMLARYRSLERASYGNPKAPRAQIDGLRINLNQIEASAGSEAPETRVSPLEHVRETLNNGDIFLSFHLGKRESWLWVVDASSRNVQVLSLPPREDLAAAIADFRNAVRSSRNFGVKGISLYRTLFGNLPESALRARRWIVELDGPLFDLPLSALVLPGSSADRPRYLCEKIALQIAPSALLLKKGHSITGGTFVGIGDPVYNAADSRYRGNRKDPPLALPRLPASQQELNACVRVWSGSKSTLLTGSATTPGRVAEALRSQPSIIHFATHIISSPGEYNSGLIALGLNQDGEMDVLGPMEIISRRAEADLVVLNGCQSAQAQAVPGSGLMGLTRAWIGAGAGAVLATRWDVPDAQGQSLVLAFYQALRDHPDENLAFALQRARQALLKNEDLRKNPSTWAAYFLLART